MMFEGKTVLVTGGTRGIGRQLTKDFIEQGAKVIATSTGTLNFLNEESVQSFLKSIKDTSIDICINNAGINEVKPFCETSDEAWDDILEVNLTGAYKISKAVLGGMASRGYGRIVNVASIWSHKSRVGRAAYSASKFGLRGLTQAVAAEAASQGVLVNSVSPGFTMTDLTKKILGKDGIREVEASIPLGRLATPKDISNVVLFLSSDLNSYISGQDIVVDGGFMNV